MVLQDLVDEFDATKPFYQQVLLIDTTIKDIQSVRIRHNDQVGEETDHFKGFRTRPYEGDVQQHVYPNGDTYNQVPSFYASVANTASMYSTTNKSDVVGEAHPGLSSDTRFGVLVPNQGQSTGNGANSFRGQDRPFGRGNIFHGQRGGYLQHLNRRGRRDAQFGRGQGRGHEHGHGGDRGNGYRRGNHHNNGNHHQNEHHRRRESNEYDQDRGHAPRFSGPNFYDEARPAFNGYNETDRSYLTYNEGDRIYHDYEEADRGYTSYNPVGNAYNGEEYPHASSGEETNHFVSSPIAGRMEFRGPSTPYYQPASEYINHYGTPTYFQPTIPNGVPYHAFASIGSDETAYHSPVPTIDSHVGGRPPYFVPGDDVGVAVPMGPEHGCAATYPRPRVVLPPVTPDGQMTYVNHSARPESFLRTSVHPPTPLGPTPGRSPMRTTTDEGSPVPRFRRHVTDPITSLSPLSHTRTTSSSGTDLRRLVAGNAGFTIAEPRSSPSTGVISPAPGSPRPAQLDSMTARSSPGLSNSSLGAVGGEMTRNASTNELRYAGYTIRGESVASASRPPTPATNSGIHFPEASPGAPMMFSGRHGGGQGYPVLDPTLYTQVRPNNGQM